MDLERSVLIVLSVIVTPFTIIQVQSIANEPEDGKLYIHAHVTINITESEYLFLLDGSKSTGDIESYMWSLEVGDNADFSSNKVQFPYWPKKGGYYEWKLTICGNSGRCLSSTVSITLKRFQNCHSHFQDVMSKISPLAEHQIADLEPPRCTKNGLYKRAQCQGAWFLEKPCYCVSPKTGQRRFGDFAFKSPADFNCRRKPRPCILMKSDLSMQDSTDGWQPECERNGQFKPKQCNPEGNHWSGPREMCWCVTKTGDEVPGSRIFAWEHLDCTRDQTKCERIRRSELMGFDSYYTPRCKTNGDYEVRQCRIDHEFNETCFCVDEITGEEKPDMIC